MSEKNETKKKVKISDLSTSITILAAIIVLWIVFWRLSPFFLSFDNINNLLKYASVTGIAASGVLMVIISGGIDLSVGSIVCLSGMVAAKMLTVVDIWYVAMLVAMVVGVLCGAVNGILITRFRIVRFITGLGTMAIFRGIAYIINGALACAVTNNAFKFVGQERIAGVPVIIFVMIVSFAVIGYVLKYTKFGRNVYSTGGNAQAAYLAGVNVDRETMKVYMVCGLMASIAGICQTSLTGTATPTAAADLGTNGISAVVLGGTAMSGGKGGIAGTILGVLLLGTINNGLTLLNIPQYYQDIIRGIILLLSVGMDMAKNKKQ